MAIGAYISIITLNVNGLNAPTKRHSIYMYPSWLNGYIYILSTRNPLQTLRHIQTESERMEKYIPCKWKAKKAGIPILISDKIRP